MSRRRRLWKFSLKRDSLVSVAAILLLLLAGLTLISFFAQAGGASPFLQDALNRLFGWGAILIPFILATGGLILLGKFFSFIKANTLVGLLFLLLAFTGLAHLLFFRGAESLALANFGQGGGLLGFHLAQFMTKNFTSLGAFFIFFAGLIVALLVLFNTSLATTLKGLSFFFLSFRKIIVGLWRRLIKRGGLETDGQEVEEAEPEKARPGQVNLPLFLKSEPKLRVELLPKPPLVSPEPAPVLKDLDKDKNEVREKSEKLGLVQETVKNEPSGHVVWEYPPLSLLSGERGAEANRGDVSYNAGLIESTLESFGIKAKVVEVNLGPAVTQYALESAQGTKIARIKNLQNDLAMALASPTGSVRIEAPIPGKSLIGIETPNLSPAMVNLKTILESEAVAKNPNRLLATLGLDVGGQPVIADIARMPHILIAGSTGSGKSTLVHAMLASLLFRNSPDELKFILVDTKRVELTEYNEIPHLLTPVITESEKVLASLKWAVAEMERRYRLFQNARARNIDAYNELSGFQALPCIIILVDEMADVMQQAPVEAEKAICRLAQMSRATGIHLVLSTQRPSVDILTGLIKANIPARIAFNVTSQIDSRVILDSPGAEKLLGRGDMLYLPPDSAKPRRIQGVYVSSSELRKLIDFLKNSQVKPDYQEAVVAVARPINPNGEEFAGSDDELFSQAIEIICQHDRASASLLQRKLKIGYARAARLLDEMEEKGLVGPADGSKPREVLIHDPLEVLGRPTRPVPTDDESPFGFQGLTKEEFS